MAERFKILVLNGPNLNLLGQREPELYGKQSLDDIADSLGAIAKQNATALDFRQSNAEHQLIDWIQQAAKDSVDYIVINPAAYAHTSVALRDALLAVKIPFIEVHLSNIYRRESFRHHSYLADVADGVICGLGARGYEYALQAALTTLNNTDN
ncbi:MAG: type II 3-dehydroquinate dehydratase [Idiomarinaceae bacterium]|uniref:type II 3-dehydroquinate dehydratase n=1 Tax=Idiomarina sp. 28-8 TaxID=1260624 RepID=UPI0002FE3A37|nr:type II 3-dehydroquinate dehydratase [Idiomarina sp. 28-8]NWO03656.1 type II 3-dehydroquinate dehydratase [Idiomarinaceae bacterium]